VHHEEERRRKTEAWLAGSSCLLLLVVMSSSPACLFIWLRPTNFEVFFSLKFLIFSKSLLQVKTNGMFNCYFILVRKDYAVLFLLSRV
jgi:hypothetical protein